MPYNHRVQLLDLLFWREIQYGAQREEQWKASGILPTEAGDLFSSVYEEAQQALETIRTPGTASSRPDWGYLEDEYFARRLRRYGKELDTAAIFYPALIQIRPERSLLDELLSHERLGLAGAGLATAALGLELYRVEAIESVNPLNIKMSLRDGLAVICVLALAANGAATLPAKHHMATACSQIADDYQAELAIRHIDKEHAQMLAEAMQACYSSPVFSASPISFDVGEGAKP